MITINNSRYYIDNIDSKHNEVLVAYLDRYALNCVDLVKIIVVDDVYSAVIKLSETEEEMRSCMNSKNIIKQYSGVCVAPTKMNKFYYIILPYWRYFYKGEEANLYERTLIHELTHAEDFYQYKEKYDIANIRQYTKPASFDFYSEMRAIYRENKLYYEGFFSNEIAKFYLKNSIEGLNNHILFLFEGTTKQMYDSYYKPYAVLLGEYMVFKNYIDISDPINKELDLLIPQETRDLTESRIEDDNILDGLNHIEKILSHLSELYNKLYYGYLYKHIDIG